MFYKLNNNEIETAPLSTATCAHFPQYLANLPVAERQAMGWYANLVRDAAVTVPFVSAEDDCILAPPEPVYVPPPPTAEEQAAIDAAALAEAARQARIQSMRQQYRDTAHTFCAAAGLPVVDKFEDATAIMAAVQGAESGELQARLFMLSMQLKYVIDELRRPCNDGDDAWERI